VGEIFFDGPVMTFVDGVDGMFHDAGFEVTADGKGRRLLAGAFELLGLFNSMPDFDGWPHADAPQIPTTFVATASVLTECVFEGADHCDDHGVPSASRTMLNGKEWASVSLQMWADVERGTVRESYTSLPNVDGWRYEKIIDMSSGQTQSAQIWESTGEPYFCVDQVAMGMFESLGAQDNSVLVAAYKGEETFEGETVMRFRIKHKNNEGAVVDYLVASCSASICTAGMVVPKLLTLEMTSDDGGCDEGRKFAFQYHSFDVVESVSAATFSPWPGDASMPFVDSVCKVTSNVTRSVNDRAPLVSREAQIVGLSPFTDKDLAIDSTSFYWDLQVEPLTLAAEWGAIQTFLNDRSNHTNQTERLQLATTREMARAALKANVSSRQVTPANSTSAGSTRRRLLPRGHHSFRLLEDAIDEQADLSRERARRKMATGHRERAPVYHDPMAPHIDSSTDDRSRGSQRPLSTAAQTVGPNPLCDRQPPIMLFFIWGGCNGLCGGYFEIF
jgi:hypothetical protein